MFSVSLFQRLPAPTVTLNLTPRTRGSAATLFRRFETPHFFVLVVEPKQKRKTLIKLIARTRTHSHSTLGFFYKSKKSWSTCIVFFLTFSFRGSSSFESCLLQRARSSIFVESFIDASLLQRFFLYNCLCWLQKAKNLIISKNFIVCVVCGTNQK